MFPPEIFSEIFSFLTSEARVLVACSQAHPIFAQLVEPILYAHVIVHYGADPDSDEHHLKFKPHQLSTLLSDKPRILNYLRSLYVDLSQVHSHELNEIATAILPGLKLKRIQLTFLPNDPDNVANWIYFPIAFRTAFVACISTSCMREICLDGVSHIPLCSFADCTGLKRLTLCQNAVPPSNKSSNFPQLEALELSDWTMDGSHNHGFFSWVLTHASGLCSLTLRTPRKKVIHRFLPHLLAICSTSLVDLGIYYLDPLPRVFDTAAIEIDFPRLPSLERLRLCTYTMFARRPADSAKNLIHYALITISQILRSFSSLKHLTLIVCLKFRSRDITQVDWSPLANFLSDRHPSFQHTDLYIRSVKAGGDVSSGEVISMLSPYENLMSLVEAGCISIKEEKYLDEHVNTFFNEYC